MRAAGPIAAALLIACAVAAPERRGEPPFGFSERTAARQLSLEQRFLAIPDPEHIRANHRILTSRPHPAGSARDRELADWMAGQFRDAGMLDVKLIEHDVLLPRAVSVSVE